MYHAVLAHECFQNFYNPRKDGKGVEVRKMTLRNLLMNDLLIHSLQRTGRVPVVKETNARYPFTVSFLDCKSFATFSLMTSTSIKATLHQGGIENILVQSLAQAGVTVDRSVKPSSLVISKDEGILSNPSTYPVTVSVCC